MLPDSQTFQNKAPGIENLRRETLSPPKHSASFNGVEGLFVFANIKFSNFLVSGGFIRKLELDAQIIMRQSVA